MDGSRMARTRSIADIPTTVSALIDATQQLEGALHRWSTHQATELEVSDIYVAVGNEFQAMMASFAYYGIDMSDIAAFPDELRALLEERLSEDPTPENVNSLMPQARAIIARMLVGLRNKQGPYWQAVRAQQQRSNYSGY